MSSEKETQESQKESRKELRFYAGMAIAGAGTCLAVYIMPGALKAYHWWILIIALLMSAGFAAFLNVADSDLAENIRLRFFLRTYLMAVVATLMAPTMLPGAMFMLDSSTMGRLMSVFPILAVFVAMTAAYVSSSNVQDVVLHRNSRENRKD
jgi:uncharacterized membrane protein